MRDSTKKKILDVSVRLFRGQGMVRTKVEDIVQEAGISRATFYNYFHSKDEIFFCLIETEIERIQTSTERAMQDEADPYLKLRIYLLEIVLGVRELIRELNVRHDETESLPAVPKKLIESMMKKSINIIIKILDYGAQAGVFTVSNPEITAHVILSSLDVFINPFKMGGIEEESIEKSVDDLMEVLCFGFSRRPADVSGRPDSTEARHETGEAR
jgi:AcrR family transcriptional regulator